MPPLRKPDALIVPLKFLEHETPEQAYTAYFADAFGRPAESLEIHEIPGQSAYLLGPAGVSARFDRGSWTWHPMPTRVQYGYLESNS
jgi:hypothetical protein